jgi:hypothetical protein
MRSDFILSSACVLGLFALTSIAVAQTGALTQLPGTDACIASDGSSDCATGVNLGVPTSLAVSPDASNVYVTADTSLAVTMLVRDRKTGALTQLPGGDACVGEGGGGCTGGVALFVPKAWLLAPTAETFTSRRRSATRRRCSRATARPAY